MDSKKQEYLLGVQKITIFNRPPRVSPTQAMRNKNNSVNFGALLKCGFDGSIEVVSFHF